MRGKQAGHSRGVRASLWLTALCAAALVAATPAAHAGAIVEDAGCKSSTLGPRDDVSSPLVPLGFTIDFFGRSRSGLYVNNNGNVSFSSPVSSPNPTPLTGTREMIAPLWADVDTRSPASADVTYGFTTYGGRQAFCALWGGDGGVGYFDDKVDKLNRFQLLLVDRGDRAAGEFDIVFNYDKVQWESGDNHGTGGLGGTTARAGFGNGSNQASGGRELAGSGVSGALLDGSPLALTATSRGSTVPGRHVFSIGSDPVLVDGPAWRYRFDEPSGNAMVDSVGGAHGYLQNGVVLGQPGALVGKPNTSAWFDGTADHGYVNGITAPARAYTLEIWMKAEGPPRAGTLIDHGGAGALYVTPAGFCLRQTSIHLCSSPGPVSGAWHHVAGTWDTASDTARLYVDGELRATGAAPDSPSGANTLYAGFGSSAPWFQGYLDEAAYYPAALTAAELSAHRSAGCAC